MNVGDEVWFVGWQETAAAPIKVVLNAYVINADDNRACLSVNSESYPHLTFLSVYDVYRSREDAELALRANFVWAYRPYSWGNIR